MVVVGLDVGALDYHEIGVIAEKSGLGYNVGLSAGGHTTDDVFRLAGYHYRAVAAGAHRTADLGRRPRPVRFSQHWPKRDGVAMR